MPTRSVLPLLGTCLVLLAAGSSSAANPSSRPVVAPGAIVPLVADNLPTPIPAADASADADAPPVPTPVMLGRPPLETDGSAAIASVPQQHEAPLPLDALSSEEPPSGELPGESGDSTPADPAAAVRGKLVEGARHFLGAKTLVWEGRRFTWDCTGTVLAIYAYAGFNLAMDFAKYPGNGVARLFRTLEARELLYDTSEPIPGDLVFFDDTYDKNRDGVWNDPLTHVGMVVSVDEMGTISYVHLNYAKGIVIESMNLKTPETYTDEKTGLVNSPMRQKSDRWIDPSKWLASHLYRVFGKGYLVQ